MRRSTFITLVSSICSIQIFVSLTLNQIRIQTRSVFIPLFRSFLIPNSIIFKSDIKLALASLKLVAFFIEFLVRYFTGVRFCSQLGIDVVAGIYEDKTILRVYHASWYSTFMTETREILMWRCCLAS